MTAQAPVASEAGTAAVWTAAWHEALSAVELDVSAAEDLLRRLHEGSEVSDDGALARRWSSPRLRGPVPPEFTERARLLLQRQLDVSERLAEALVQTRAERRAIAKLEPAERPPVFVDQAL